MSFPQTRRLRPTPGDHSRPPHVSAHSGSASGGQDDKTSHLIKYLFLRDAEYDHRTPNLSYLSISPSYRATHESGSPSGSPAKPVPTTAAESRLLNSSVRADLVSDLIETFFNIVHIRMPLLNPTFFRMRYHGQDPEGCPSDALLAVVIAWGAKFSENPIIVADRQESLQDHQRQIGASPNATDARVRGKSRIAEDLVLKAQEVLERAKVHRIASVENVQAMLLIEPLFRQYPRRGAQHNTPDSFRGFWAMASVRHLFELRVNKRETMSEIEDPQLRGEIIFAWWMACMVDATSAAFFRRKPLIEQDDYTVEPPCGDPNSTQEAPHPLASLQQYM